jgi:hypothetical protein
VQKALEAYNRVRYTYKDRVQNYHLELELKSRLLIVKLDTYSFRTRFIDGLPLEIQETLMKCKHIMAEYKMIQEIVRTVYNIEESNNAFDRKYKEALKHQGTRNHDNVVLYLSKGRNFLSNGQNTSTMNLKLDSQISHKMPQDNSKLSTTQKDVHFQDKLSQPWDSTRHVTMSAPHVQVTRQIRILHASAVGRRVIMLVTLNALIMAIPVSANMISPNYEWHTLTMMTNI